MSRIIFLLFLTDFSVNEYRKFVFSFFLLFNTLFHENKHETSQHQLNELDCILSL